MKQDIPCPQCGGRGTEGQKVRQDHGIKDEREPCGWCEGHRYVTEEEYIRWSEAFLSSLKVEEENHDF